MVTLFEKRCVVPFTTVAVRVELLVLELLMVPKERLTAAELCCCPLESVRSL